MADPAAALVEESLSGFNPESINYGVDGESYLTEEQRKLARQIQGKFDASLNRRDRELARYNAPRLSSFVEDEALARAMALARGLNMADDPYGTGINQGSGGGRATGGGGGSGGGGRYPYDGTPTYRPTGGGGSQAQTPNKWASIMSGLTSIAPLLFGKDAYGRFMNEGAIKSVMGMLGMGGIQPMQFEQMVYNAPEMLQMGPDVDFGTPAWEGGDWGGYSPGFDPTAFEAPASGWEGGDWGGYGFDAPDPWAGYDQGWDTYDGFSWGEGADWDWGSSFEDPFAIGGW